MRTLRRNRNDQGFTLIEILVVVIIIGVLAAIAIPIYLNQRKKAIDASLRSDLKNAATIVETVLSDPSPGNGIHPHQFSGNTVQVNEVFANAGFKVTTGNRLWIRGVPSDDTYQICAYNPDATTARSQEFALLYDNQEGGLTTTIIDCRTAGWFGFSYDPYA